jgi:predicted nucleic acid-binding Zn ribbon protein
MKKPDRKCQVCGSAISRGNVNRSCSRKCAVLSRRIDPLVRIKRNIAIDQRGCWVWQRRKFPNGYACIRANVNTIAKTPPPVHTKLTKMLT